MKLFAPKYYTQFRCIGGGCTKNCCIGWEIDVDNATMARYNALAGSDRAWILDSISKDGECPHFKLCDGERCANLRDDNLCSIIAECGEDMIPEICREHPRFYNIQPDRCEVGIGLACPSAAELILSCPDHSAYEIGELDVKVSNASELEESGDSPGKAEYAVCRVFRDAVNDFSKIASAYGIILFAAYHSSVTLSDLLFDICKNPGCADGIKKDYFLSRPLKHIDTVSEDVEVDAVISLLTSLEMLDLGYAEKIENAIRKSLSGKEQTRDFITDNKESFFSLFQYFIYRHLPEGALDGSVYERVVFAAIAAYTVLSLSSVGGRSILDEAVDFSRNIEYSDSNLYDFIDGVASDGDIGVGFILNLLKSDTNF